MKLMRINSVSGLAGDLTAATLKNSAATANVVILTDENNGAGTVTGDIETAANDHYDAQYELLVLPSFNNIATNTTGLGDMTSVDLLPNSLSGIVGLSEDAITVSGMMEARISSLGTGLSTSALSIINSDDGGGIIESGNYVIPVSQLDGSVNIGVDTFNNVLNAGLIQTAAGFTGTFTNTGTIGTASAGYTIRIASSEAEMDSLETMAEFSVNGLDPADPTNKTVLVTYVRNVAPVSTAVGEADYITMNNGYIPQPLFNATTQLPSGTTSSFTVYSTVDRVVLDGESLFSVGFGDFITSVGTTTLVAGKTHAFDFVSTSSVTPEYTMLSAEATFTGYVPEPVAPDGSLLDSFGELLVNSTDLLDTVKELGDAATDGEDDTDHNVLTVSRVQNADMIAAALQLHADQDVLDANTVAAKWTPERYTTDVEISDAVDAYNVIASAKFFQSVNLFSEVTDSAAARVVLGLISQDEFLVKYNEKKDNYLVEDKVVTGNEFALNANATVNDIKWIRMYYPGGEYDELTVESAGGMGTFLAIASVNGDLDGETVSVRYVERAI